MNNRVKIFGVAREWRGKRENHQSVFFVCCYITNLELEVTHLNGEIQKGVQLKWFDVEIQDGDELDWWPWFMISSFIGVANFCRVEGNTDILKKFQSISHNYPLFFLSSQNFNSYTIPLWVVRFMSWMSRSKADEDQIFAHFPHL